MTTDMLFTLLIALFTFLLGAFLWAMVVIFIGARRKQREDTIEGRLGLNEIREEPRTLRLWRQGQESTTSVLGGVPPTFAERFTLACSEAGWESDPKTILIRMIGLTLGVAGAALLASKSVIVAAGAAGCTMFLLRMYVCRCIHKLGILFDSQLVDALEMASRSLRVGHALPSALRLASEEIPAPVGTLFGSIVQQQALGIPLEEAVTRSTANSSSEELKLFATAVVIQIQSGGNLADMMDRVVSVMRDRMRLTRRIRILTAQTQLSKQILLALPLFMFVLLNFMNSAYMRPLYTTASGHKILLLSAAMLALGAWVMNKLAVVDY